MLLVFGLRNPPSAYANTRHNVSELVINFCIKELSMGHVLAGETISFERIEKSNVRYQKATISEFDSINSRYLDVMKPLAAKAAGQTLRNSDFKKCFKGGEIVFAQPMNTYMNVNGKTLASAIKDLGISNPGDLIIVHDELSMRNGKSKLGTGVSARGHNGVRSCIDYLKRIPIDASQVTRLQVGIGRPHRGSVSDYVLEKLTHGEMEGVGKTNPSALAAILFEAFVCKDKLVQIVEEKKQKRLEAKLKSKQEQQQ
eukprot:Nk52_evm23s2039 gene=Nk52_evmTU23s2039